MTDKKKDRKSLSKIDENKIEINVIKEEEVESKENNSISFSYALNTKDKSKDNKENKEKKENKGNLPKNSENEKGKIISKAIFNENINQRINNFINYSNQNLHNRYYSSNISNHIFRNFIKKANYNKNRDNLNNPNNANIIQNYFDNDFRFTDNRPYSFTSRINNNYINKGFNYILGNANPNNINQKEIIDYKKRQGYDYKKYHRGKRNNYVNKNIFFNGTNNMNQGKYMVNPPGNNFNNNYPQNSQLINNFKNNNEVSVHNNRNNMTSSKQKFLHMNDFLILDNLQMKIANIGNSLLNYIANNMDNNLEEENINILNNETNNNLSIPLKIISPGVIDYYKNNNNIAFNCMNFNMNMNGNLFG